MSVITASPEIDISQLEGAPDDEWLRKFNESYNETGRQVVSAINRRMPFTDCEISTIRPYNLVHAQSVTIKNPLTVPIKAVYPVACVGLSVDSTGKPTRGVYNLAMPSIEWHNSTEGDGSIVVTAQYQPPLTGSGAQGERVSSFVPPASAVTITGVSATSADITSIQLTAGTWDIDFNVAHLLGTVVTATLVRAWVHTVSATDPGTTTSEDQRIASTSVPVGGNPLHNSLVGYRVTPTATTTYYFSANMSFTDGVSRAPQAYGRISAVRAVPYLTGVLGRVGLLLLGDG